MLEVCSDTKKVKLTFLHPQGPSNSFKYPEPRNIHNIPMDDILTLVDPRTRSGRVYSLTKKRNDFCYRKASLCIITVKISNFSVSFSVNTIYFVVESTSLVRQQT